LAHLLGGSDETQGAFVKWLRCRTRDFLSHALNGPTVEALATELENNRTLSYQKAVEVMNSEMNSANLPVTFPLPT
jgi:hypothetical protein